MLVWHENKVGGRLTGYPLLQDEEQSNGARKGREVVQRP